MKSRTICQNSPTTLVNFSVFSLALSLTVTVSFLPHFPFRPPGKGAAAWGPSAACERVQRPCLWRRGLGMAAESPTRQNRLNRCQSRRPPISAADDGNLGVGRNTHQCGLGLDADADTPKGGKFAGGFGDGEHGGAIADPDNRATLPGIADQITGAETEGMIIHGFGWWW